MGNPGLIILPHLRSSSTRHFSSVFFLPFSTTTNKSIASLGRRSGLDFCCICQYRPALAAHHAAGFGYGRTYMRTFPVLRVGGVFDNPYQTSCAGAE